MAKVKFGFCHAKLYIHSGNMIRYTGAMFLALAAIFFITFLAFIAIAPNQLIQAFLAMTWFGMGLSVVYTILAGLFS